MPEAFRQNSLAVQAKLQDIQSQLKNLSKIVESAFEKWELRAKNGEEQRQRQEAFEAELRLSDLILGSIKHLFVPTPYNNGYDRFLEGFNILFEEDSDQGMPIVLSADMGISYAHKVFDEMSSPKMFVTCQVFEISFSGFSDKFRVCSPPINLYFHHNLAHQNAGVDLWPTGIGTHPIIGDKKYNCLHIVVSIGLEFLSSIASVISIPYPKCELLSTIKLRFDAAVEIESSTWSTELILNSRVPLDLYSFPFLCFISGKLLSIGFEYDFAVYVQVESVHMYVVWSYKEYAQTLSKSMDDAYGVTVFSFEGAMRFKVSDAHLIDKVFTAMTMLIPNWPTGIGDNQNDKEKIFWHHKIVVDAHNNGYEDFLEGIQILFVEKVLGLTGAILIYYGWLIYWNDALNSFKMNSENVPVEEIEVPNFPTGIGNLLNIPELYLIPNYAAKFFIAKNRATGSGGGLLNQMEFEKLWDIMVKTLCSMFNDIFSRRDIAHQLLSITSYELLLRGFYDNDYALSYDFELMAFQVPPDKLSFPGIHEPRGEYLSFGLELQSHDHLRIKKGCRDSYERSLINSTFPLLFMLLGLRVPPDKYNFSYIIFGWAFPDNDMSLGSKVYGINKLLINMGVTCVTKVVDMVDTLKFKNMVQLMEPMGIRTNGYVLDKLHHLLGKVELEIVVFQKFPLVSLYYESAPACHLRVDVINDKHSITGNISMKPLRVLTDFGFNEVTLPPILTYSNSIREEGTDSYVKFFKTWLLDRCSDDMEIMSPVSLYVIAGYDYYEFSSCWNFTYLIDGYILFLAWGGLQYLSSANEVELLWVAQDFMGIVQKEWDPGVRLIYALFCSGESWLGVVIKFSMGVALLRMSGCSSDNTEVKYKFDGNENFILEIWCKEDFGQATHVSVLMQRTGGILNFNHNDTFFNLQFNMGDATESKGVRHEEESWSDFGFIAYDIMSYVVMMFYGPRNSIFHKSYSDSYFIFQHIVFLQTVGLETAYPGTVTNATVRLYMALGERFLYGYWTGTREFVLNGRSCFDLHELFSFMSSLVWMAQPWPPDIYWQVDGLHYLYYSCLGIDKELLSSGMQQRNATRVNEGTVVIVNNSSERQIRVSTAEFMECIVMNRAIMGVVDTVFLHASSAFMFPHQRNLGARTIELTWNFQELNYLKCLFSCATSKATNKKYSYDPLFLESMLIKFLVVTVAEAVNNSSEAIINDEFLHPIQTWKQLLHGQISVNELSWLRYVSREKRIGFIHHRRADAMTSIDCIIGSEQELELNVMTFARSFYVLVMNIHFKQDANHFHISCHDVGNARRKSS